MCCNTVNASLPHQSVITSFQFTYGEEVQRMTRWSGGVRFDLYPISIVFAGFQLFSLQLLLIVDYGGSKVIWFAFINLYAFCAVSQL